MPTDLCVCRGSAGGLQPQGPLDLGHVVLLQGPVLLPAPAPLRAVRGEMHGGGVIRLDSETSADDDMKGANTKVREQGTRPKSGVSGAWFGDDNDLGL